MVVLRLQSTYHIQTSATSLRRDVILLIEPLCAVLAKDGSETDAVIAKAVCYVNLGKYQEAVDVIKKKDVSEI